MIKSYHRQGVATVVISFTVLSAVCAQDLKYHVEEAPEWTQLFYRTDGWFGADGIFSIGLDGDDSNGGDEKTLIIFSDSFIGKVTDGAPEPGYKMVNNTIAYFDGTEAAEENLTIHVNRDDAGVPMSFFIPDNPNSKEGQHFWLGDGFINKEQNDRLYIFG